jgi:tetratricopeptide (TPR) repeat protein
MLIGLAELGGQPALRARALNAAGLLAYGEGDYATADSLHTEALDIGRQLQDAQLIASSIHHLGRVAVRKEAYAEALDCLTRSLAMWRELGDRSQESVDLTLLGGVLIMRGEFSAAYARWAEGARLCRAIGDKTGTSEALSWQGFTALQLGNASLAASLCDESLQLAREDRNRRTIAWSLLNVALVRLAVRDHAGARAACLESAALRDDTDEAQTRIALALEILACIAADNNEIGRALRLFGAAQAIPATRRTRFAMFERVLQSWRAAAESALGEPEALAALAEGRTLTAAEALAEAVADELELMSPAQPR